MKTFVVAGGGSAMLGMRLLADAGDGIIETLTREVPAVGAIAFLVWIFLRHLEKRDILVREMSVECHRVQTKATDALAENARALGRVDETLRRTNQTLHATTRALDRKAG